MFFFTKEFSHLLMKKKQFLGEKKTNGFFVTKKVILNSLKQIQFVLKKKFFVHFLLKKAHCSHKRGEV